MPTHYRLQPPFLYVAEQQDFSKAWEHFCCKLLNLKNKTNEIYVRNPPEQGVDLYYPSQKIAYQCKSIESGKSGDFNATKVVESIKAAKRIKKELGWEKYYLCVNVAISGTAEETIKKALPDIKILPNSHWVDLCENNAVEVERNFRRLVDVPRAKVLEAINDSFVPYYSDQLKKKVEADSFDIFLYTNRHDTAYRVPVAAEFTISELINIFQKFFKLPGPTDITSEGIRVSLSHSIVFNGKPIPLAETLKEVGITHGSIITYWTKVLWKDTENEFNGNFIHMMTSDTIDRMLKPKNQRRDAAISIFENNFLRPCFDAFDNEVS